MLTPEDESTPFACSPDSEAVRSLSQRNERELFEAKAALERQAAELRRSLAMVQATLESTTDGILVTRASGEVVQWNSLFLVLWRLAPPALPVEEWGPVWAALSEACAEPEKVRARVDEIVSSGAPESYDLLELADGRFSECVSRRQRLDARQHVRVWSFRDVTDRHLAEIQRNHLAAIVTSSADAVIGKDLHGIIQSWNEAAEQMFGYSAAEIVGTSILRLIPEERHGEEAEIIGKIKRGESFKAFQTVRRTKSGRLLDVSISAAPIKDGQGNVVGASKTARDVTAMKRAQARFRRLVDSNAQGVFFWNTRGQITGANDAFLQMTGYTREDLEAGRFGWVTLTPPEFVKEDEQALAELSTKGVCATYEKEYIRKDGGRVPLLISAALFEDNSEEGLAFTVDLTERKKLEQQFLRSQRMESIGTLAGGIAHDLNNVLGPIMMALSVLKLRFPDPGSQELLEILETSAGRGAEMVRQVLSFARGSRAGGWWCR